MDYKHILSLVIIGFTLRTIRTDTFHPNSFTLGTQYEYSYSAEITLKEVDKFHFNTIAFLFGYRVGQCEEKEGILMREDVFGALNCTSVQVVLINPILVSVQAKQQGHESIRQHNLNFSQWFSFYQRQDGLISNVLYPENEDREVLQLKKAITSSFSIKKHSYVRNKGVSKKHGGWTYRVSDVDHSGTHSARYEVNEKDDIVTYKKIKRDPKRDHVHNKEVQIHSETGHIKLVRVQDTAVISHSSPTKSYSIEEPPPIKANGISQINLIAKSSFYPESIQEPAGLIMGSIIAQRVEREPLLYRIALFQIRSNLSLTENCFPSTTAECVKTIRKIVNVIQQMREQDITQLSADYLSCPFKHRHSHVFSIINAFGMCHEAVCQFLLVSLLNASCVEREMAFTILPHLATTKRPTLFTIDMMDQLAFKLSSFPEQLYNHTLSDMAVLALGSMSASLRDSDPLLSDRILAKLHRMTLPHDNNRYKRDSSITPHRLSSGSVGLMRQSSLIDSLGNAAHEQSFSLLKSFVESQHAPSLLRRSAIYSMRNYHTDEAADTILSAALVDEEEVVRHEATLRYKKHPKADEMSDILYEFYNYTNAQQSPAGASKRRIRRFSIFDALSFHLQTPSFNWKKVIGSDKFGASMGLIVRNIMDLNIKPLSGTFEVDIFNEGYFKANLGYVGVVIDVFLARVCFKGHISYNLNILQDLGINSFSDLAHLYDNTIGAVVNSIKSSIVNFRNAFAKGIDLQYLFHEIATAVKELPGLIKNLVVSTDFRKLLVRLKQIPFIQSALVLIDQIKSVFTDVRGDVLKFYQEVSDCVTVTLPWVGGVIKTAIKTIVDSIKNFISNPLPAIADVTASVVQLKSAFEAVIECKDVLINATKFQGAHIRGWMDLINRLKGIYNTIIETRDLIIEQAIEFSEIKDISTFEEATGLDLTALRMKAYKDLKTAMQNFTAPIAPILNIVKPFVSAFKSTVNIIQTGIKAYETLREVYEKASGLIERLFGPKLNGKFPRKIRGEDGCEQTECKCGFYPTTSGDPKVYKEGLQILADEGDELIAPVTGLYLNIIPDQVLIIPGGSLRKYVMSIHHVTLVKNITKVGININAGSLIGKVSKSKCQPNFIHLTMMTKSHGTPLSPAKYLQPRLLEEPKWISDCNDYKLEVLNIVIRQGTLVSKPTKSKMGSARTKCKTCSIPKVDQGNENPTRKIDPKPNYHEELSGSSTTTQKIIPKASSNGPNEPSNRISGSIAKYFTKDQEKELKKLRVARSNGDNNGDGNGNGNGDDNGDGNGDDNGDDSDGESGFNFSVDSLVLSQVLQILSGFKNPNIDKLVKAVNDSIAEAKRALNCDNQELTDPLLLDVDSVKNALKLKGEDQTGDKEELIAKLIKLPSDLCPNLQQGIPENRWCTITKDCLTLKCASTLKLDFLQYSVNFSLILSPCIPSITLKFQDMEKIIVLPSSTGGLELNMPIDAPETEGLANGSLSLNILRNSSNIKIDFTAHLCKAGESSEDNSHCFYSIDLLTGSMFTLPDMLNCTSRRRRDQSPSDYEDYGDKDGDENGNSDYDGNGGDDGGGGDDTTSCGVDIPDFYNMGIGEFIDYIKDLGDSGGASESSNSLSELTQNLKTIFLEELLKAIISGKNPLSSGQSDFPTSFDFCIHGNIPINPQPHNFFSLNDYIFVGFVPLHFEFSLDGSFGVDISVGLCFLSMKANVEADPNIALVLSGSAAISLGIAEAGIELVGKLMDTHLPTTGSIVFKKFPLAVSIHINLNLIPLTISLHVYLKITIHLIFVTIDKTLFDKNIFSWSAPAIKITLLDISNANEDKSPPQFSSITSESRRRRSFSNTGDHYISRRAVANPCTVTQVAGRDYTNPGFILQVNVADDKSQVELTYSVGTYPGGENLVKDERMSGSTVLIAERLKSGIPLYWTAKASNSQGVGASSQCTLPNYDTTPPLGRVEFDYKYSSNPSILIGDAVVIDETPLATQHFAIGYAKGVVGDQIIHYTVFSFDPQSNQMNKGNTLSDFLKIPDQRLGVTPFKTATGVSIDKCIAECATFPQDCYSFNYAPILKICQILSEIAGGSDIQLQSSKEFDYYERQGIGSHKIFTQENLQLSQNELYFLNVYVTNTLLYESYLSSEGILVDFTPPEPGRIVNASKDEFLAAGCDAAINQRCVHVTPNKNNRIIIDGYGSDCIYNGPTIESELMYTRLNSFVSITFHGFHDNETGIYAYTWYMGYQPCGKKALSPRDPNADSTSSLSDINQGRVLQHFADGIYYATVQALNQVIFGGSGVLTLCHSTPYVIDTTRPIIYAVKLLAYNETSNITTFYYNADDKQSGLQQVYVGAGLTFSDTLELSWKKIFTNISATLKHKIDVADGKRAFVRIRAIDNVGLVSTSYGPIPIVVDRTPPIPGEVLDGEGLGNSDWNFQLSSSKLCAKWRNFFDPDSGISAYRWGAGTAPGLSNTIPFTANLPPDQDSICRSGLRLTQNTTYYSTVIAFNADTDHPRNTSVSSNGVLVDLTDPIGGFVRDGNNVNENKNYTSNPTTVQAMWGNFSDPESGIAQYNATIYVAQVQNLMSPGSLPKPNQKCPAPSNNHIIPVKPPFIPPDSVIFRVLEDLGSVGLKTNLDARHFHLSDNSFVRTKIIGQDGATRTVEVMSQGFLIDLTPPLSYQLFDGGDPSANANYQLSVDSLQASWIMIDTESGIQEYRLSVYVRTEGTKSKFYPDSGQITIQPQEIGESGLLTCWTHEKISLAVGSQYIVRIEAINRAGISAFYDSTGIIPDNSPPTIDFVKIDTYGDLSQELDQEGAVEIGNSGGIPVQWFGTDPDSGVIGYEAAVVTNDNSTDVQNFTLYPPSENVFIKANLKLYEVTKKYYYVIARAKNGVGLYSKSLVSTKIKVLRANVAGVVTVGHSGVGINGNFQAEKDTVTLRFGGFSSELCGIQYYEWLIGTSFGDSQIQEITTAGVVDISEGSGVAQSLVTLNLNESVYTGVRAITACSAGDGEDIISSYGHVIKVDWTIPDLRIRELGKKKGGDPFTDPSPGSHIYQFDTSSLIAEWDATDTQSGIWYAYYTVGTSPFNDGVTKPTATNRSSLSTNEVKPDTTGVPNILQITVFNRAGLPRFLIAPGVTVSTNYPNVNNVEFYCTPYALQNVLELNCHWSGAVDIYSGVEKYEILLGDDEGGSEYIYTVAYGSDYSITLDDFSRKLLDGVKVYTMNIINNVGLLNNVFTFLTIDNTLPISQSLEVLVDQTRVYFYTTGELNSTFSYYNYSSSTICKTIATEIRARWEDFIDDETPMKYYEIGVGDTAGQDNIYPFHNVSLANEYLVQVKLMDNPFVYVTVRGFNLLGLTGAVTSKSIAITVHNPDPPTVDDPSYGDDFETQTGTSYLQAEWDFGDPCSEIYYEWAIRYMNRSLVQNYTRVTTIDSSNDNLDMTPETKVYIEVNMFSPLGYSRVGISDPVIVEVDPLIPGLVFDGPFTGMDFRFQASLTTLSANWDSFGGNDHTRLSQKIHKYEIAAGTGLRGKKLYDVFPYKDVKLNTSFTLMDVNLTLNNTYYITIRATSATNQLARVTSNGIQPIHFDRISEPGTVKIPYFQSTTSVIDMVWKNFTSLLPFIYYEYGISTVGNLTNTSCEKSNAQKSLAQFFDILPFVKSNTINTAVVSYLNLEVGTNYYAYVRTIDDAFQCSTAVSNPLSIDITPPVTGSFTIGFDTRSIRNDSNQPQISYITTNNTLSVSWYGFYDPESSIMNYHIAFIELTHCNLSNCDQLNNLTTFSTLTNVTNHTFYVLDLIHSKFYFVALRAVNRAGLTSCKISQPVKLDRNAPNQAVVKHGTNWNTNPPYQGSTVSVGGILAIVTDEHEALCMDRMYNLSSSQNDWHTVTQSVTPTIPVGPNNPTGKTLAYSTKQAQFNSEQAFLKISMARDIQHERMESAAASTSMSVDNFNEMSVRIKAAPYYQAVTSVLIWDGPSGMIQDYEIIDESVVNNTVSPQTNSTANNSTVKTNATRTISFNTTVNIQNKTLPCDFMPPPNPNPIPYKSFGLQLHPANKLTPAKALLWYRSDIEGETAHTWITLGFDPTISYHTYHLVLERVASTTPSTVKNPTWSVLLSVDEHSVGSLVDLPQFNSTLYFVLHVRNYNGRVEPVINPFFPPTTSAFFTDIILPVDSTRVCKYGAPFYSARAPFVKFEVGVGRDYGSTNYSRDEGQEYHSIPLPCIPCDSSCLHEANTCNSSCNSTVYYISFEATGLELVAGCTHPTNQSNTTCTPYNYTKSGIPEDMLYLYNLTFVPYVYYMKARGYTAAGHIAYGYSVGIQLDTTPPECTMIQHIQRDLRSNDLVNTTVQYSTNSLAVEYACKDTRSDIYGYEIAYTSNIENISSLQFNSVGTDITVNITNLVLNPTLRYYVVVKARNGAGLTTVLKSKGVRILNTEPDVSRAVLKPMFAEPIDTINQNTSISTVETAIGISWTGIYATRYEDNYTVKNQTLFWKVGTEPGKDDILPIFEINFDSSVSIRIDASNIIGNSSFYISNIIDLAKLANKTEEYNIEENILQMEPGRILYQSLVLCAIVPRCETAGTISVNYYRAEMDTISVCNCDNDTLVMSTSGPGPGERETRSRRPFIPDLLYTTDCVMEFSRDLKNKSGFIMGYLTMRDMSAQYDAVSAPTSSPYVPYIVNPRLTLYWVDRLFFARVIEFYGPSFFLSPIGGVNFPSWLKIQIKFNPTRFTEDLEPVLLGWNPVRREWISARTSCNFTRNDSIIENILTSYFCPCTAAFQRCNKPWHFIVVVANTTFVDTAPVLDKIPCISITESTGTIQHMLTYTDAENDSVQYNLTSVTLTQSPTQYYVNVSTPYNVSINDSWLYITPPVRVSGNLTIKYTLTEIGTPAYVGSPLNASSQFTVYMIHKNHNPLLITYNQSTTYIIYRDEANSPPQLNLHFYTYDKDKGDQTTLRYSPCTRCTIDMTEESPYYGSQVPSLYHNSSIKSVITYSPMNGFYGEDTLKVVAEDNEKYYSQIISVLFSVRYRVCLNGGICMGPTRDPECNKLISGDFSEEYHCECTMGWTSKRCETPNLCLSHPCPYNTTCHVKENGEYQCICLPSWPCYKHHLETPVSPLVVAAITIGTILLLLLIVLIIFIAYFNVRRYYTADKILFAQDSLGIPLSELRAIQLNRDYVAEVHSNIHELQTGQITTHSNTGIFPISSDIRSLRIERGIVHDAQVAHFSQQTITSSRLVVETGYKPEPIL